MIDYDSDGRDDFLEHWQTPTYYVGNGSYQSDSFNWALKPDGQLNLFSTDTVDSIRWLNPDIHRLVPADFTMSADIDGDGHPDLFGGNTSVFYGSGDVSLSRITDGLGKAVDIHYGTSALGGGYQPDARCAADNAPGSSWPEKCLPRMSGIVAGHTEGTIDASGSLVPERTYTYTYVNGRMNLTGHGWLGFDRKIISAVSSAPGDPGTTTTIDYEPVVRYTPGGQVSTHVDKPYLYPFAGLPKITTVDQHVSSTGASNPPLQNGFYERRTQTVNHWGVQQSAFNRPFPVVTSRTTSTYDRPIPGGIGGPPPPFEFNGTLLTSCDTSLSTDNYGNLWYEDRKCSVGTVYVEEFRTTKTFIPDLSAWLISNPENITISNIGTLGAEREYHLTYSQGLLDTVTRAPNELGDQWHKSTYVRDGVGNVWQVIEETLTDPSRTTTISYDDDGLFPSTVTNAAGQTTQISFDANWGVPDGIVDPNGIAVQFAHDGFGRLTKRQGPDGATLSTYSAIAAPDPTTAAGSIDPKIQVRVDRTGADGSRDGAILTEYDGYGRPVRTTSEGLAGAQVIQERVYDQLGRVSGNTLPHTPNSSPEQPTVPFDHYTYDDPLKRVTRVDHSDGSFKQYQYASWASIATAYYPWFNGLLCAGEQTSGCVVDITRTIDEELRENVVFADYTGKVIRNVDGENTADTAHTSNYVYGPFDQLLEAHDNRNLATKFDHDDYGRLLVQTDPDTGASVFTYNGFDELRTSKDPKQQLRTYNHDSLGRIESIVDPDGLTQWIYDQGPNALGRLSESISPATQENPSGQDIRYSYEPATETANRGFLQSVTYTIDGAPYSVSLDYDDLGRTSRIHYPSAGSGPPIVAQYKYDNSGVLYGLDEVGSGTPHSLWNVIDVFQGHLIQNETLGNGSSATHTTYGYNSDRHWLENVQTTLGSEQIQTLKYTHYTNGLVHTFEAKGSDPREYIYDKLNRLAFEIASPAQSPPVSTPYTYDEIGNLVGRGSNINSYRPTQPHLLQFAGNNAYDYDANGNVATRTGPGIPGGQQNIAYTAFDLPRTISTPNSNELLDNVHFDYSADEERLTRRDPDGTTRHFVADLYQRKFDSFGTTQEERFRLYAGDRQIAEITRKDSADQTLYFHPDHLGSPETISDNNGAAYHQHFDPFGARVEPTSPELTRIGFTGQE